MGFFDSDIVQQEAKQLFEDYQSMVKLAVIMASLIGLEKTLY